MRSFLRLLVAKLCLTKVTPQTACLPASLLHSSRAFHRPAMADDVPSPFPFNVHVPKWMSSQSSQRAQIRSSASPPLRHSPVPLSSLPVNVSAARPNAQSHATGKENQLHDHATAMPWRAHESLFTPPPIKRHRTMLSPMELTWTAHGTAASTHTPSSSSSTSSEPRLGFLLDSPFTLSSSPPLLFSPISVASSSHASQPSTPSTSLSVPTSVPGHRARTLQYHDESDSAAIDLEVECVPETPLSGQGEQQYVPATPSPPPEGKEEKELTASAVRANQPRSATEGKEEKKDSWQDDAADDIAAAIVHAAMLPLAEIADIAAAIAHAADASDSSIVLPVVRRRARVRRAGGSQRQPAAVAQDPADYNAPLQRALSNRALSIRNNRRQALGQPLFVGCRWTVQDTVMALQLVVVSSHGITMRCSCVYHVHAVVSTNRHACCAWLCARQSAICHARRR